MGECCMLLVGLVQCLKFRGELQVTFRIVSANDLL